MRTRLAIGVLTVVAAAGVAFAGGALAGAPAAGVAPANDTADNDTRTLPPGLGVDGVTDPLALARAHDRVLRNVSYTVTSETTHRYRNGTLVGSVGSVTRVAADGGTFARHGYGTFPNGSGVLALTHYERDAWSNGSVTLVAQRFGDRGVEYDRVDGAATRRLRPDTGWETVYATFGAANTTVVDSVERDGSTLYRVVAVGVRPDSAFDDARPFTLMALVDERGVVRLLSVSHPTTYDGRPAFVARTLRVTDVGDTTVERPAWYGNAVENTTVEGD